MLTEAPTFPHLAYQEYLPSSEQSISIIKTVSSWLLKISLNALSKNYSFNYII